MLPIGCTTIVHDTTVCILVKVYSRDFVVELPTTSLEDGLPNGGIDTSDKWEGRIHVVNEVSCQDRQDTRWPFKWLQK
jgi:hypothetical protein